MLPQSNVYCSAYDSTVLLPDLVFGSFCTISVVDLMWFFICPLLEFSSLLVYGLASVVSASGSPLPSMPVELPKV